jgi:CHAD domain-containing protein
MKCITELQRSRVPRSPDWTGAPRSDTLYPPVPQGSDAVRSEPVILIMAHAVSVPSGTPSEHRNLAHWMKRSLEELANLRSDLTSDTVHDLRVVLRRCRSVASVMQEIDPHPDWEEMRGCAKKLFRSLGKLRDAHIMAEWLNKLHPEEDALKRQLLESLETDEKSARDTVQRHATRFDEKRWKKLSRALRVRIRRAPADGPAAHCLALERLEEAKELHRRAMRTDSAKPWHALRIGAKHFRYTVESLLPTAHAEWSDTLKRVQDVLGNIHDLDVLSEMLAKANANQSGELFQDWELRIENERQLNVQTYRQLALGTTNIWTHWQSGFPREEWERYAKGRIRATRAAMDPKPGRSAVMARIAMRIWSQLRLRKAGDIFSDKKERQVLETAARLSGVRNGNPKKAREKSAKSFLLDSPVPPGWTFSEWERAAWAIRFQRGVEPGRSNKRFAQLAPEQQTKVYLLAGILRLAITAQKCGVAKSSSLRLEVLPQGLLLHVAGVEDSPKNAARFTEAKQQLERSLGKSILIQAEPAGAADANAKPELQPPVPISIVS